MVIFSSCNKCFIWEAENLEYLVLDKITFIFLLEEQLCKQCFDFPWTLLKLGFPMSLESFKFW